MCIKLAPRTRRAWTLVEMMVAVGIFSLVGMALMGTYIFSVKSMASMYSYSLLDQYNRQAMDQLTREIRQSKRVLAYTTNSITIQTANDDGTTGPTLPTRSTRATRRCCAPPRTGPRGSFSTIAACSASNCSPAAPATPCSAASRWRSTTGHNTVKVLQLTWKTSMMQPSDIANSENVQTARIVIRKQQDQLASL